MKKSFITAVTIGLTLVIVPIVKRFYGFHQYNEQIRVTKETTAIKASGESESKLADIVFDESKYPENYIKLGSSTISRSDLKKALEKNSAKSWYSIDNFDQLGRSGSGTALVTYKSVTDTSKMKRPPFGSNANPTGYVGHNQIVQLNGYRGYVYNRSHTLGWSLVGAVGGNATSDNEVMQRKNLTTGTRAQNVGTNGRSESTAGGMAYPETMIRNFVRSHNDVAVYYTVTPVYHGKELVPRGSHVQAKSVQDNGRGLELNIWVFNTQPGLTINYQTGSWQRNR